jgi:hypothetical protein
VVRHQPAGAQRHGPQPGPGRDLQLKHSRLSPALVAPEHLHVHRRPGSLRSRTAKSFHACHEEPRQMSPIQSSSASGGDLGLQDGRQAVGGPRIGARRPQVAYQLSTINTLSTSGP